MPQLHAGALKMGGVVSQSGPYLIDLATQTMLWIDQGSGTLSVRGDVGIWDRIVAIHAGWQAAGRPGPASCAFVSRPPDEQQVVCHCSDGRHQWPL